MLRMLAALHRNAVAIVIDLRFTAQPFAERESCGHKIDEIQANQVAAYNTNQE
ncbi:hypothetical protein EIP86_011028 [Pleurotus ostreatoroseus]|nr:hypothetical protein EIP86_011028 [Pleurotus ostreatoroseus]